jgi:hypothetical protein
MPQERTLGTKPLFTRSKPSWGISEPPGVFSIEQAQQTIGGSKSEASPVALWSLHFFFGKCKASPASPICVLAGGCLYELACDAAKCLIRMGLRPFFKHNTAPSTPPPAPAPPLPSPVEPLNCRSVYALPRGARPGRVRTARGRPAAQGGGKQWQYPNSKTGVQVGPRCVASS